MKKSLLWILTVIITLSAAYYQRKTGPTYPKQVSVTVNEKVYKLKLVRSLALDEKSEVKLKINDPSVKARIFYKRLGVKEDFQSADFVFADNSLYAPVLQQPAAGKIQYYVEITDSKGTQTLFMDNPVTIRFKGGVPPVILGPHVLIMFIAMLFSTLAGLMAVVKDPSFKKYAFWTLILLTAGGMILGPIVQKYAFGELWTGIPFGWDLTDNKTLIAFVFWAIAVFMNRKTDRPYYTILAAIILLIVYSIPHSMFGSELDYSTGKVTQGMIMIFF